MNKVIDSDSWFESANRLMRAISVLKRGTNVDIITDEESIDASLIAMMLVGFAFENAFKGYLLFKDIPIYKSQSDKMISKFTKHEYTKWCEDHSIKFQSNCEKEALDKAEYLAKSWARYPVHNTHERPFETWGWSDVDKVKELIKRLQNNCIARS